ncbi:transmembrane domain-containing protein [Cryptosporidium canis]|uniref:Transmembrane domain-containing protein n=1 Tax=Cryptosporidium canis TaxID=195482 RepID=A0A9D5DGT5_9CRYT|nr:transmembrane domain-containing protein [Cryptosporidium canis]
MVKEAQAKSNSSSALTPNSSESKAAPAPAPVSVPIKALPNSGAPINVPVVSVNANERSEAPNSSSVIQVPPVPKEGGENRNQTSSTPTMPPSQATSSSPPKQTASQEASASSVPNQARNATETSSGQKLSRVEESRASEAKRNLELNGIGSNLDSRRSVESTKFSLVESELDSKFPDIKTVFNKDGLQEVRVALIFIVISLIMVIGFSIRKYRKLRKGGEQVRNITNTVFPVKIVSLYLYIFLSFPITVLMQFLSCIAPLGFGMFNVIQSIYQSSCYIWLWDLFVEYFGGSEQIVTAIRRTGPYQVWKVPPFMIPTSTETYFQPKIVIVSYILVIQFLPINVLVSILNAIHPSKAFLYNTILIISLSISVYGIMLIYWPSKEALQPYQGGWKFGILVIQSFSIIVIDSIIRLAKYENREYNSAVYKLYWKLMLTCGVATICTLAAVAIIDSREIYQIYNLSVPTKNSENIPENKAMLAT